MPIQDLMVNGNESTQLVNDTTDMWIIVLMNEFERNNDLPRHRGHTGEKEQMIVTIHLLPFKKHGITKT